MVRTNYPGNVTLVAYNGDDKLDFKLDERNFNPLSANGKLQKIGLIYGNKGSLDDLQKLKNEGLLEQDFILLLHYSDFVSEQIMAAEKFKAKGVIFISEPMGDDGDVVQTKSVAIPQYGTGDALTPGWYGSATANEIDPNDSKSLSHIPSLPISHNQGKKLLSFLGDEGVKFENGIFSGKLDKVQIDLEVEHAIRDHHAVDDIIGKLEGREQNDKAIIIGASRNSVSYGSTYPNYGTCLLYTTRCV